MIATRITSAIYDSRWLVSCHHLTIQTYEIGVPCLRIDCLCVPRFDYLTNIRGRDVFMLSNGIRYVVETHFTEK